ncbi:hypothetical protein PDJAM_G00176570 [Pangasius djambal]|uniref:Uncharacterized protein n=1 Tax=Pangasius djambal TaxID=1691987 RepID=A0ACC5ZN50_9TELE|nr:hypothetical protein [Pangasius djambal]
MGERVVIGADFNGHVGEGNTGDEEVMGKFGVKERNLEGQMVVDFAKSTDMAVVNTYFQKREEHRLTYKSGGRSTQVVLPDDWETTAEVIRVKGRKVVSSGRRKEDKETWWRNEEVQDSIQRKSLAKKKWDMDRTEENRQEYKELQCRVKREVSKAKQEAYDELYTRLDTREGQKDLYRQREKRKGKSVGLRIGTLNVGTMTGKGRELADMMERRKVDILCVQETRWKGSKARSIGAGFKLFYCGVDSKRNGVGVVLKEEFVKMSLKLEIEGVMLNVVSGYAPQVGCELEEKERFWSELDEVIESMPTGERVVMGADFNGHVGEGNAGDEEMMGKFGVKERNLEGQMVVDFAKRMDMAG